MANKVPETTTAQRNVAHIPAKWKQPRNKTFDLLRILFSVLVLLAHAPAYVDVTPNRELLMHAPLQGSAALAEVAVDGFFLLSGYLILQSWDLDPRLGDFLQKRLLRIAPGWVCAVVVSVVVSGLLAPAVPHYFHELAQGFLERCKTTLETGFPNVPRAYPNASIHEVSQPLWTIPFEFRCYLLIACAGVLRITRVRWLYAALTLAAVVVFASPRLQAVLAWPQHDMLLGWSRMISRFAPIFLIGSCFYLFRAAIPFRPWMAGVAAVLLVACRANRFWWEPGFAIFGGYLLFYLGSLDLHWPPSILQLPDISYGLYLYGGLVECLCVDKVSHSPWVVFLISAPVAAGLGWLSWHYVERPALRFKRRPTAALPS